MKYLRFLVIVAMVYSCNSSDNATRVTQLTKVKRVTPLPERVDAETYKELKSERIKRIETFKQEIKICCLPTLENQVMLKFQVDPEGNVLSLQMPEVEGTDTQTIRTDIELYCRNNKVNLGPMRHPTNKYDGPATSAYTINLN